MPASFQQLDDDMSRRISEGQKKKFCCVILWDSRCGIMGEIRQFLEPEGGISMAGIGDFCGQIRK